MLVLVTGGAGFIGSHLVEHLLALGHKVRVIDDLSTGKLENIQLMLDRIDFVHGDICELDTVQRAMQGVTYVFHQAALPSVPRSIKDPARTNSVNVDGTLNVFIAAKEAAVRRVVFASSSSVYGNSEKLPKEETMTPAPLSPYAVSKLTTEYYGKVFHRIYGLETVALRYFNVFGPRQDPSSQYSGVISKFVVNALTGQPHHIYGDGLQSRDFTYVDNVVQANLLACLAPGAAGEVFNIACGSRLSLLDLAALLNDITGTNCDHVLEPERPGDVKHSLASVDKAGELIGYSPLVSTAEGLKRTVAWYQQQLERVG